MNSIRLDEFLHGKDCQNVLDILRQEGWFCPIEDPSEVCLMISPKLLIQFLKEQKLWEPEYQYRNWDDLNHVDFLRII